MEWGLAGARLFVALGVLIAGQLDPSPAGAGVPPAFLAGCYLLFAGGVMALVWAPVRFGPGADIAVHAFDLGFFAALTQATGGGASTFFPFVTFLLVCATVRWQIAGTVTAALTVFAVDAAVSAYASSTLAGRPLTVQALAARGVFLAIAALLLGWFGALQHRFVEDVSRLADWPRRLCGNVHEALEELIAQTTRLLKADQVFVVWEEREQGPLKMSWLEKESVVTQNAGVTFESHVAAGLRERSFQARDVGSHGQRVITLTTRGFVRRRCDAIHESLRARFATRAVQSWPLEGEFIRGRIFCVMPARMSLDDLVFGQVIARLAVSRLDSACLVARLRGVTALEARIRVARDLHDGLLQAQAGAALQLMAARRMLESDPGAARARLENVQILLEQGEIEMRRFIKGLRVAREQRGVPPGSSALRERCERLRQNIADQWALHVSLVLDTSLDTLSEAVADHVFSLVQEAFVNAARHADASHVRGLVTVQGDEVRLTIQDDGRGFPFSGTYDLQALQDSNRGPVTLKERIIELNGQLTLRSFPDSGAELRMTVPVPAG